LPFGDPLGVQKATGGSDLLFLYPDRLLEDLVSFGSSWRRSAGVRGRRGDEPTESLIVLARCKVETD